VFRAVKEFQGLRDVRYIDPQPQPAGALPESPTRLGAPAQPRTGEAVHRLAQPDMAFAPELLGGRQDIVIEPDRGAHNPQYSIIDASNIASLMRSRADGNLSGRLLATWKGRVTGE
jgi:hypothetical protein